MAKAKNKQSAQMKKALRSVAAAEVYYAKILCSMSGKARLKIYRKLSSLLRNRFSLMDRITSYNVCYTKLLRLLLLKTQTWFNFRLSANEALLKK